MKIGLPEALKSLVKASNFWKENYLILREFKNVRNIAVLAVTFALLAAFFEGLTVGLIAAFLQGLTNPEEPPIRTGIDWFNRLFLATEASAINRIYRLSIILLVGIWIRSGLDYLSTVYGKKTSLGLVNCLRRRLFDQLESFRLSFYSSSSPGALISTLRGEVLQVQQAFDLLSTSIVFSSKLLAYMASMLILSWQLFLTSVLVFGLMSVGLTSLTRQVREASFEVPRANKAFTSTALSFISGIRTIHASGTQAFERRRYAVATRDVYNAQMSLIQLSSVVKPLIEALGATLLIGMVAFSYTFLIATGRIKAAEVLTFLFVLIRTTPLVSGLNGTRIGFISAQGAMRAVTDLLQRDGKPYFEDGDLPFSGLHQSIEFESVDFSYVPGEPILHDITLSIKRGEMTALVGSSGGSRKNHNSRFDTSVLRS